MSIYIFVGPSLPVCDARRICPHAIVLPPVRLGDVWRAAAFGGARAIGIVDGYFERMPAVWHKEILWALSQGVPVAGAASMGALRAAELSAFGMQGIGRIFEAYRSGCFAPFEEPFEDDDEVAVSHGPAESGWLSSEAMVNIRATLAAAAEAGVIGVDARDRLAALGKRLFYKDRSWATLLRGAAEAGIDSTPLAALRAWLPSGRVDQKRQDAAALLHWLANNPGHRPDARFHFADTALWRRAIARPDEEDRLLLDELRLRTDDWSRERDTVLALLTGGTVEEEPPAEPGIDPEAALRTLSERADRQARRMQRLSVGAGLVDALLLDQIRACDRYRPLRVRAEAKRRYRQSRTGTPLPVPPLRELILWFAARSACPLPAEAEALVNHLNLPDAASLLDLLADEYGFVAADLD